MSDIACMALHLPGKVSRLISDFSTLCALIELIPYELEKRIVARHCTIKLDALSKLLPRLKNKLASSDAPSVLALTERIRCFRNDYEGSQLEACRDAMSAHSLQRPAVDMVTTWLDLNSTIITILNDDVKEIDRLLLAIDPNYPASTVHPFDVSWPAMWKDEGLLGDPNSFRFASHPAGMASADIMSMVPGGHPVQDATLRVSGIMTSLRQIDRVSFPMTGHPNCLRLMAEIMLIDYCALWEALFDGAFRNDYGLAEPGLASMWAQDGWKGAQVLAELAENPHPNLDQWKRQRNQSAAHLDADMPIQDIDLDRWPLTFEELKVEAYRVMNITYCAALLDIRSQIAMMPPTQLEKTLGLSGKEGTRFDGR